MPASGANANLMKHAMQLTQVSLRGVFKHDKDKSAMNPWELVVVTTKQIIVPGKGNVAAS